MRGLVVYGCDHATAEKAKKSGKLPHLVALSQTYQSREAAEQFVKLAASRFTKMEIRTK